MKFDFTVDPDDRQRLEAIFDTDVERLVGILARAGASELIAQATGCAVFSSITDLRQHRLFCPEEGRTRGSTQNAAQQG